MFKGEFGFVTFRRNAPLGSSASTKFMQNSFHKAIFVLSSEGHPNNRTQCTVQPAKKMSRRKKDRTENTIVLNAAAF
jgi:hypothetical protein